LNIIKTKHGLKRKVFLLKGSKSRETYEQMRHVFYDRMTVRRNRFLVNKTNRCTEFSASVGFIHNERCDMSLKN